MTRRIEILPALMTLAAVLLMAGLGVWQLQRLAWKEGLIAQIDKAHAEAPMTQLPQADFQAVEFFPVKLRGTFDGKTEFHIAARYYRDKLGYHILSPLRLQDGRVVLVNRGWVPVDKKEPATRPETVIKGAQTVTGIIRTAGKKNWVLPDHQPGKNLWFWYDTAGMGASTGAEYLPLVIDAVGSQDAAKLPVPSTGEIKLRNDHLGYAITWFSVALTALVIGVAYQIQWRRKQ